MEPVNPSSASVPTELKALATVISDAAQTLQSTVPLDVAHTRVTLQEACHRILTLAIGPAEMLKQMVMIDRQNLASLQVINHYKMASIIPTTGTMPIADLSDKCDLPVDIVARVTRQAMSYGAFSEPKQGHIAHTDVSLEIPRLSPLLSYQLEVCLPSMARFQDWLEDENKEHKSAFQIAHNTTDTWWSYASKRPELIENYGRYMALITTGGAHDVSYVLQGFAWGQLGTSLVVDVGCANGLVGITLAEAYPDLTVIVEDNVNLKKDADANIPSHLRSAVIFLPHSFFKPQPSLGRFADVFLLRHILHDWDDEDCRTILRCLSASMKPGASIVVAEQILGQTGEVPWQANRVMRALDMQMMIQFGSKERTYGDWRRLFTSADPSFEIVMCVQPDGSADSFMEVKKRS